MQGCMMMCCMVGSGRGELPCLRHDCSPSHSLPPPTNASPFYLPRLPPPLPPRTPSQRTCQSRMLGRSAPRSPSPEQNTHTNRGTKESCVCTSLLGLA